MSDWRAGGILTCALLWGWRTADSDEAAPSFRDDCAPGFRDDLAPVFQRGLQAVIVVSSFKSGVKLFEADFGAGSLR
ncbi:MAG: hypothetical protein DI537_27925 [Stutzerimonas stutzeri]|nr:MAG: hypothetical protein DI537_27925 [Stutzerimonas stutzeri]